MKFKSLRDLDLFQKTVLVRVDLNVPVASGHVTDTTRIDRLKPTINYLIEQNAKILLLSHFGRPKGTPDPELSLRFILPALEEQWGQKIDFAEDCIGQPVQDLVARMPHGSIGLLENARFHPGEKDNDPAFAKAIAEHADIYVNDAFSVAHRAHVSTHGLAKILPTAAGLTMEAELKALNASLEDPQKPVLAIAGGSKISTKINVLNNLVKKVDYLVLGGAMANTFLYAEGMSIGSSMHEGDMNETVQTIKKTAKEHNCIILLPQDLTIVKELGENAEHEIVEKESIPSYGKAVDIGPQTAEALKDIISECKTVLWNGPLGVFECKPFDAGTNAIAQHVASLTKQGTLTSVAGGGDTAAAIENAGTAGDFSYVSTAGGAFLEWLEGKPLPGIEALDSENIDFAA